jgi:hypothetical protein
MRTLIVALGFAALAADPAWAQGVSRASDNGAAASAARNATTNAASSSTGTGTTAPSTAVGSEPNLTAPAPNPSGTGNATVPPGGVVTNTTTDPHAATPGSSFAPGGPFSNDSGNSALGTSAGQSSSGTLAGNSGQGIGADSTGLGTNSLPGVATIVPEGNVSVIGGTTGGGMVAGAGQQVQPQQVTIAGSTPTPLFDQAAREGRAKEARRRAAGNEPRIYGIAPNSERDLTWQMPDDKIIRY